jgi:hypothetical protein
MIKKLKAVCGLNCLECPAYVAYKTNDDTLRVNTANEWSKKYNFAFKKEMINCSGCLSKKAPQIGHCNICVVRNCAINKNIQNCVLCEEFKNCSKRKEFEAQSGLDIKKLHEN